MPRALRIMATTTPTMTSLRTESGIISPISQSKFISPSYLNLVSDKSNYRIVFTHCDAVPRQRRDGRARMVQCSSRTNNAEPAISAISQKLPEGVAIGFPEIWSLFKITRSQTTAGNRELETLIVAFDYVLHFVPKTSMSMIDVFRQ